MIWFKAYCGTITSPQMNCLRSEKRGNELFAFWIMLNNLAAIKGGCSALSFSESEPYTPRLLGTTLGFGERFTEYALEKLAFHGYLTINADGAIILLDWDKEQTYSDAEAEAEKSKEERKREYDREYRRQRRNALKSYDANTTPYDANTTPYDANTTAKTTANDSTIYIEKEKEIKKDVKAEIKSEAEAEDALVRECTAVQECYNGICKSFPNISVLSKQQKAQLASTLKEFSLEQLKECFIAAEESEFLKSKGWASFDWLIKPENLVKVLNGNYRNDNSYANTQKGNSFKPNEVSEGLSSFDVEEATKIALARAFDDW